MIRLHKNLTLLSFASPQIAREVKALYPLEQVCRLSYNPQAYLLDEQYIKDVTETLSQKGYTPRVEKP